MQIGIPCAAFVTLTIIQECIDSLKEGCCKGCQDYNDDCLEAGFGFHCRSLLDISLLRCSIPYSAE